MDSTLLKGLNVLEALVRANGDLSISELAEKLHLVRSNVHRTLHTLVHAGYVQQVPGGVRYRPTLRLWELGCFAVRRFDLKGAARPALEALSESTRETIGLAALDGLDVVFLDTIDAQHSVGLFSRVGMRMPAYCTALGRAILAGAPSELLETLPSTFERYTDRTVSTRAALLRELQRTRERGYAVNRGEWREGVNGVAALVVAPGRPLAAAVSISGPENRFGTERMRRYGLQVAEVARSISEHLT